MRVMEAGKRGSGEAGKQGREREQASRASYADLFAADLLPRLPASPLPVLDNRARGTRFLELPVRSVLNTPASTHMGFWSINPYVGCEFGCTYCYARDTHRWVMERAAQADRRTGGRCTCKSFGFGRSASLDSPEVPSAGPPVRLPAWEAFEKEILVKTGVAEVLARTLDPARLGGHSLVIGTATDPYQPAERRFRLTRRILEVLRSYRGLSIEIITKSPLVTRDIDLLQALAERHEVTVNVSLATLIAGSRAGSSCARRCQRRGSGRCAGSPRRGLCRTPGGADHSRHHRRPGRAGAAHGRGEGGGCPLRDRVGAPARSRGAAPLPSRARARVPGSV